MNFLHVEFDIGCGVMTPEEREQVIGAARAAAVREMEEIRKTVQYRYANDPAEASQ